MTYKQNTMKQCHFEIQTKNQMKCKQNIVKQWILKYRLKIKLNIDEIEAKYYETMCYEIHIKNQIK